MITEEILREEILRKIGQLTDEQCREVLERLGLVAKAKERQERLLLRLD